jgi:hypothetical protein
LIRRKKEEGRRKREELKSCIIPNNTVGAGSPTLSNAADRLNKPAPTPRKIPN